MPHHLTPHVRDAIVNWYILEVKDQRGFLLAGRAGVAAVQFNCTVQALRNAIARYNKGLVPMQAHRPSHVSARRGRPPKLLTDELILAFYDVAQEHIDNNMRCTNRRLQQGLLERGHNHSVSSIHRWKIELKGKYVSSYLKPALTAGQRLDRLNFVNEQREPNHQMFESPRNKVHIDETWYYLDRNCVKLLVFPGQEAGQPRRVQHKSHVTKVMMITAVGMPHARPDGSYFDGKIGTWAVVERVPAVRASRNRPQGTLETKSVSLNAELYRNFWTRPGGIRAKIRQYLPHLRNTGIIIQQDGATAHTGYDTVNQINQYIQQGNWNCTLVNQPPQSPDLNLLDLGLFHGMKAGADGIKGDGRSIDTCIQRMVESFTNYSSESIQIVWAVLFDVYRLIRGCDGNNNYKLPHSGIRRRGRLNQHYVDRHV